MLNSAKTEILGGAGNVWDNAAMESFSSLKTERTARKICRSRDEAKADVFGYIERLYNAKRRLCCVDRLSWQSNSGH